VFINVFVLSISGSKNYEQQTKFASENEMLKEAGRHDQVSCVREHYPLVDTLDRE